MMVEDPLPFTVLVPESPTQPIEVFDQYVALLGRGRTAVPT
jgi:hypothetical protein